MRLVRIDNCEPGLSLGKTIYNHKGKVLLAKGTILSAGIIKKLKKHKVFTIYIEDAESEGIDIVESIPVELRMEAENVITEGLNTIAGLNSPNVRGMLRTDRTVRTFQKVLKDILSILRENKTALNLLASTKIHEDYVYNHSLNVTIYASQLAIANGLPIKNIEEIALGSMLHDVGKTYIPKEILTKPAQLNDEEFEEVKKHTTRGYDLLRKIHEIPVPVAHCAYQHHERIDGSGYPRGLKGDEIHTYGKILGVADVFDAVTSHRVYRPAMLPHKGLELLYSGSGTKFETKLLQLFKDCIAIYPQGMTVKLNDGRSGIVSEYNSKIAGRPIIRIIKDELEQAVAPYEIDLSDTEHLTVEIIEADALL